MSWSLLVWLKALRAQQWLKNGLVFLPIIFSHKWSDSHACIATLIALLVFSAAASSVYLFNDVLDRAADRAHPRKKHRPIASGLITPRIAVTAAASLTIASAAIAWVWESHLGMLVLLYLLSAHAYSLGLKRLLLIDVMMLAGFYTLRIFAGAVATGIPVSEWLLLFSLFFFVGLAFQKRTAEVRRWSISGTTPANRRGYQLSDLEPLRTAGSLCSYLAVLVFALYLQSTQVTIHYARPQVLWWIVPLLLFWTSRIWLLDGRDEVSDDVISFTIRDPISHAVTLLTAVVLLLAQPL